jgi:hypothetical protein
VDATGVHTNNVINYREVFSACLQLPIFNETTDVVATENVRDELGNVIKRYLAIESIDDEAIAEFTLGDKADNLTDKGDTAPVDREDLVVEEPSKP